MDPAEKKKMNGLEAELRAARKRISELERRSAKTASEKFLDDVASLFMEMFRSGPEAKFAVEAATGKILECNPNALELFGYERGDLIGKPFSTLEAPNAERVPKGKYGATYVAESRHRKNSGEVFAVEMTGTEFAWEGRKIRIITVHPVSDRDQVEKALEKSEKRYKLLAQNITDVIWTMDMDLNFTYISPSIERLLGYAPEEMMTMGIERIVPPEDLDRALKLSELAKGIDLKSIREYINPMTREERQIRKDGEIIWAEVTSTVLFDERGEPEGFIGVSRDVTSRKDAEEEIKAREKIYRFLAENVTDVVWTTDLDFNLTYISPSLEKVLQYKPSEFDFNILMKTFDRKGRETIEGLMEETRKKLADREDSGRRDQPVTLEFRQFRKDGHEVWSEVKTSWMYDKDDHPVGFIGVVRDVTERKKAEEALRRSEERLQLALDATNDGLWDFYLKTGDFYVNPRYYTMLEFEPYEMAPSVKMWIDLLHPDDRDYVVNKQVEMIQKNLESFEEEFRLRTKSGGYRWILSRGKVVERDKDQNPARILGTHIDVTDRKGMERDLLEVRKLESLGVLAGGLAHDFKNIIASIMGNLSIAKFCSVPDTEIFEYINEAETACTRAQELTQQLLTFSKGGSPAMKTTDIAPTVKQSALFVLRGTNVGCEIILPPGLWPVRADEGQISQVINNVVINAGQAMPKGGTIRIRGENVVLGDKNETALPAGKYLRLDVVDFGKGIAPEHLPMIFDPYFTTKPKGTGLGLATSFSIIKKHGGAITVDSKPGVGTAFHIYLQASEEELSSDRIWQQEYVRGTGKVLIMDDEEMLRRTASRMLQLLGYTPEVAADGDEAILKHGQALKDKKPYDLIIMDLTVQGGKGGKEATEELLNIDPWARVIVASAYDEDPVMRDPTKYGFISAIPKPFKMEEIGRALNEALSRS